MKHALQRLHGGLPLGSIDAYIQQVNAVPLLTLAEEQAYATRLQQDQDLDAARQLVQSHLRFVVKIARGYLGYGLPLPDLIQEGNIGLMKAVKRFDVGMGVRLVSFAVHWIKAEIHEFILRNWRIVKIATTKAQRKLFFNLRRAQKRLLGLTQSEAEDIAHTLGVSSREVQEMHMRLRAQDVSFDPITPDEGWEETEAYSPAEYLTDPSGDPAYHVMVERQIEHEEGQLREALAELDPRTRSILQRRWLVTEKATLQDLSLEHGISIERVRQIEQAALKKLKKVLT